MNGIFGDLFDLDGDGSLNPTELAGDYALADELMNEEEQEERAQENEEAQGVSLTITLASKTVDKTRLAEIIAENSEIRLSDVRNILASAQTLSLHCRTIAEARYMKQRIEETGAGAELPQGLEEAAVPRQPKSAAADIRRDIEETLAQPAVSPSGPHSEKEDTIAPLILLVLSALLLWAVLATDTVVLLLLLLAGAFIKLMLR